MNIGFIGLGIMGEAMCANIIKKHDGKVFCMTSTAKRSKSSPPSEASPAPTVRNSPKRATS